MVAPGVGSRRRPEPGCKRGTKIDEPPSGGGEKLVRSLKRLRTNLGRKSRFVEALREGFEDVTAVLGLPGKYRRRIRSTNRVERLIEDVRRREKVIRIFPNKDSAWRYAGAVLVEIHEDEITSKRRYLDMTEYEE